MSTNPTKNSNCSLLPIYAAITAAGVSTLCKKPPFNRTIIITALAALATNRVCESRMMTKSYSIAKASNRRIIYPLPTHLIKR